MQFLLRQKPTIRDLNEVAITYLPLEKKYMFRINYAIETMRVQMAYITLKQRKPTIRDLNEVASIMEQTIRKTTSVILIVKARNY
jgi:hypothetical protein